VFCKFRWRSATSAAAQNAAPLLHDACSTRTAGAGTASRLRGRDRRSTLVADGGIRVAPSRCGRDHDMFLAMLLPLFWGLGGVVAVALLARREAPPLDATPRIDVNEDDALAPAA
jgi:hypothetical protein